MTQKSEKPNKPRPLAPIAKNSSWGNLGLFGLGESLFTDHYHGRVDFLIFLLLGSVVWFFHVFEAPTQPLGSVAAEFARWQLWKSDFLGQGFVPYWLSFLGRSAMRDCVHLDKCRAQGLFQNVFHRGLSRCGPSSAFSWNSVPGLDDVSRQRSPSIRWWNTLRISDPLFGRNNGFGWMVGSLEHYFDVSSSSKRRCLSISDLLVNLVIRWWGCQIGFFFLRDGECLMGSPASDRHPMNDVGRPQKKQHAHIVMNILYIISMSITI